MEAKVSKGPMKSLMTWLEAVWVRSAERGDALMIVDSEDHLDLKNVREVLQSGRVSLVPEDDIETLTPDCDPGAMPAVGRLFGLPTYADRAVRDTPEISFNAGSHTFTVRADRAAWEQALGVVYADLKVDTGFEAPWSPS